jgi:hypothetical protein
MFTIMFAQSVHYHNRKIEKRTKNPYVQGQGKQRSTGIAMQADLVYTNIPNTMSKISTFTMYVAFS